MRFTFYFHSFFFLYFFSLLFFHEYRQRVCVCNWKVSWCLICFEALLYYYSYYVLWLSSKTVVRFFFFFFSFLTPLLFSHFRYILLLFYFVVVLTFYIFFPFHKNMLLHSQYGYGDVSGFCLLCCMRTKQKIYYDLEKYQTHNAFRK